MQITHTLFPIDPHADTRPREAEVIEGLEEEAGHATVPLLGGAAVGLLSYLWAPLWLAIPLTLLGAALFVAWIVRTA